MKRLLLVLIGALAGIALVVITNIETIQTRLGGYIAKEDGSTAQNDSEDAVAVLERPEDPGQRREIAASMERIALMDDNQWTKRFTLRDSDGKDLSSDDLKGQPYVRTSSFRHAPAPASSKQNKFDCCRTSTKTSRYVS